jgi:hypothetical protein
MVNVKNNGHDPAEKIADVLDDAGDIKMNKLEQGVPGRKLTKVARAFYRLLSRLEGNMDEYDRAEETARRNERELSEEELQLLEAAEDNASTLSPKISRLRQLTRQKARSKAQANGVSKNAA